MITKKTCCICKKNLEIERFASHKKRKDGFQSQCKDCQKDYRKLHYENNKQKYVDKAGKWRKDQKKIFYQWLKTKSCADCGNNDFRVLEFDHQKDKEFNISNKTGGLKLEELMKEINKCDIVCANCHRIRTANQFNYYKVLDA